MQLREENRYNFEECQKLREVLQSAKVETENMQHLLRGKEVEAESLRKDIELHKNEREHLESRISDLLERSKNIDIEDYNRLKSEVEQLHVTLTEKDAVVEETRKVVAQKEEVIAKLEQDLSRIRLELSERESRLSQAEASLKSDAEKQKKLVVPFKRKIAELNREKELLIKEKEALLKEKDSLVKERELLAKEKELLSKEKEELSKQLEDLRQEKKSSGDALVDPKEKEKDARIQILESTLGRLREDNKKEKEKRMTNEKIIAAKVRSVDLEKKKFENEHGKHKEALKKISDELEKLKHAKDSLPEGTSVVQLLSGSTLDDLASAYVLAVESFEKVAHSVFNDVGNQASVSNTSTTESNPSVGVSSQALPTEAPSTISSMTAASLPKSVTEDREKRVSLLKTNVETRKTGRKLVRPRLRSSEEPQRDVEMSDLDGKNGGKPAVASEMATQSDVPVPTEHSIRKRPASPSPSEVQEESLLPEDSSSDMPEPAFKKSKGLEPVREDVEEHSGAPENSESVPTVEALLDAATGIPQSSIEEPSEFVKEDFDILQGLGKEAGEPHDMDDEKTVDIVRDSDIVDEEHAEKPSEADTTMDEASNLQTEKDVQQHMTDVIEREGELPEGSDLDGADDTAVVGSQDVSEVHPEHSGAASIPSPARNDEFPVTSVNVEVNEMNSPDISNPNEQAEEGEFAEDVAEDSDKSADGNDQINGDADHTSEVGSASAEGNTGSVESVVAREGSPIGTAGQDVGQLSHVRTSSSTININERARQRAAARLGRSPAPASTSTPSTAARRGRAPLTRSRGGRAVRGGRRPMSGDQS